MRSKWPKFGFKSWPLSNSQMTSQPFWNCVIQHTFHACSFIIWRQSRSQVKLKKAPIKMDLSITPLKTLPNETFNNILKYLSIDERINARPAFPIKFDPCFNTMNQEAKKCTAFGINLLQIDKIRSKKIRKLCSVYHLYDRWQCASASHIPRDGFSTNKSIMEPVCF